jgi:Tn3 transposase DDE domain
MDRQELPNLARRLPDQLHTSSDGQKFEVRVDSLNANYSFKYFGKDQGVAAYTFRDERDLLWYSTVFIPDSTSAVPKPIISIATPRWTGGVPRCSRGLLAQIHYGIRREHRQVQPDSP